jgi:transcriptional regulator GlxA family with amidase domain
VFDDVEELDFVGPWEVFQAAEQQGGAFSTLLLAEQERPVRCAKRLRVLPEATLAAAPPLDVILVPGGQGTRREAKNPAMLRWIADAAARCKWVTSVCTGALLLHEAGVSRGKRVTTHFSFVEQLRQRGADVVAGQRYVRDGNLVSAAGVSAGIDMALWLVGQIADPAFARKVQDWIEYHPEPPYA